MRACVLQAKGGLDQVALAEVESAPEPGPGEVRVALRAAAVNHLDLHVIAGLPGIPYPPRKILGADGAGVIERVGRGVTQVQSGDRVLINPGVSDYTCEFCLAGEHNLCVNYGILGEHLPGTLAEFITIPGANVARVPTLDPPLSWAEAAAFTLVTLTAWRMIVSRARVRAGEQVLIWGIGGGVSLAALQIAKRQGARVIATSSSDAKLERAKALGADVVLNHKTQQVAKEVRALTERRGVDVVVENVGEATWEDSLKSLAKGGRLVTCGATTGPLVVSDVRRLFWNHLTIMGSTMGNAAEFQEIVSVLSSGALRPVVDRAYPLAQFRTAFERLERGEQLGKIVLEM